MEGVSPAPDLISIIWMFDNLLHLRYSCPVFLPTALIYCNVRNNEPHPKLECVTQFLAKERSVLKELANQRSAYPDLDVVKAVRRSQHEVLSNQDSSTEANPSQARAQVLRGKIDFDIVDEEHDIS